MSIVYVSEPKVKLSVDSNRMVIEYPDGMKKFVPIETLDGVTLLGNPQMTTQFVENCLTRGIQVSFFSKGGKYFGRLISTGHVKAELQRQQSKLYFTDFSLNLAKRVIKAKVRNQSVLLRRYSRNTDYDPSKNIENMRYSGDKIDNADSVESIMGYEGIAAKEYFAGLSRCVDPDFKFNGRNRRPPRDPFNSMISLGYSILMNELYGEIENRGLNPYFGFIHRDAEKHPTLASDMMEEWRAVIVDSTVMSLINGHEVAKDQFVMDYEEPGCYLNKDALRVLLDKIEKKMTTDVKYLTYIDYPINFRRAISFQMKKLVDAIENEDPSLYEPLIIR